MLFWVPTTHDNISHFRGSPTNIVAQLGGLLVGSAIEATQALWLVVLDTRLYGTLHMPLLSRGTTAPPGSPSRMWGLVPTMGDPQPSLPPLLVVLLLSCSFTRLWRLSFVCGRNLLAPFLLPPPHSIPPLTLLLAWPAPDTRLLAVCWAHLCLRAFPTISSWSILLCWDPCGSIQHHTLREASLTTVHENTLSAPYHPPDPEFLIAPTLLYLSS